MAGWDPFSGEGEQQQRDAMLGMGQQGRFSYNRLGTALDTEAERLRRQANGQDSMSALQLRAGLDQTLGQQRSMAASAAPQNQAMANINASRNAMTLGSGVSGQTAMAGIAERAAAGDALGRMLLEQRRQEQEQAQFGYGKMQPGRSWLDRFGGAIQSGAQLAGMV